MQVDKFSTVDLPGCRHTSSLTIGFRGISALVPGALAPLLSPLTFGVCQAASLTFSLCLGYIFSWAAAFFPFSNPLSPQHYRCPWWAQPQSAASPPWRQLAMTLLHVEKTSSLVGPPIPKSCHTNTVQNVWNTDCMCYIIRFYIKILASPSEKSILYSVISQFIVWNHYVWHIT